VLDDDDPDDVVDFADIAELDGPAVSAEEQAKGIAQWIYDGRGTGRDAANAEFPGLNWLRQPATFSDREWILAIAEQYCELERTGLGRTNGATER
jgi:hypothetical protein